MEGWEFLVGIGAMAASPLLVFFLLKLYFFIDEAKEKRAHNKELSTTNNQDLHVNENTPANDETNTGEETNELGEVILLDDEELKVLYDTDFESFWKKVVKEAESLNKIPDSVYNYITDSVEYGENATRIFLNRMKFIVERANWEELLKIKNEMMSNNAFKKLCMLDVIEEYEHQNIVY